MCRTSNISVSTSHFYIQRVIPETMRDNNYIRVSVVILSTCLLFIQMYSVIVIVSGGYTVHGSSQKNKGAPESLSEIDQLHRSLIQTKDEEESDEKLGIVLNKMLIEAKKREELLRVKKIEGAQQHYPKRQKGGQNGLLKDPTKEKNIEIPFERFKYPLNIDMSALLMEAKSGKTTDVQQVNLYGGKNIHAPWRRCAALRTNVFVVFIIKSFAINFESRKIIRQTWSNESLTVTVPFKRIFLIGSPQNSEVQNRIDTEQEQNRDIVQVSVDDNIYNSTVKTLRGLNWAVSFCSKSQYYMMIQDDLFVATENLLRELSDLSKRQTLNYAGFVHMNRSPIRYKTSPWFISMEDYPFDKYPDFVFGGALILSFNFSRDILLAAKYTRRLNIDDVFIGILAYKLGVKPQKIANIEIEKRIDFHENNFKDVLISCGYGNEDHLKSAWIVHKNILSKSKRSLM